MRTAIALAGICVAALTLATAEPADGGGKALFERRCGGCHSPDRAMEGPPLRGVYGRRSASLADFQYSEALKNAKITWNEELLDKWLTDTEALVPGNDMAFRVVSPDERREIVAYLKTLPPQRDSH
jgi:cytochrome c